MQYATPAALSAVTFVLSDLIVQLAIFKRRTVDMHRMVSLALFGAVKGE